MTPHIVHLCGYGASGLTTVARRVQWIAGSHVAVCELDEMYETTLNQQIQAFIEHHLDTPVIVLVGTGTVAPFTEQLLPAIAADTRVWLDVSLEESTRRGIAQQFAWINETMDQHLELFAGQSVNENVHYLTTYCSYPIRLADWATLWPICEQRGFVKMDAEKFVSAVTGWVFERLNCRS